MRCVDGIEIELIHGGGESDKSVLYYLCQDEEPCHARAKGKLISLLCFVKQYSFESENDEE